MAKVQPTSAELRRLAAYSGDPWSPGNPYFASAEPFMEDAWNNRIYPFIRDCDFTETLDLAAGHGRSARYLLRHASRLHLMDIQEGNIQVCQERLYNLNNVEFYVNNGYDFLPIAARSLTFIYCFDAMVHFEPEVIASYLFDASRVLQNGGRGFFHHSNYTGGWDWRTNPHARNYMSHQMFGRLAEEAGLRVVRQQIIDWGEFKDLDCLTVIAAEHG